MRRHLSRARFDDSGLTTLEWLLIVAAVAGLAALAVVLVQNVVSDTSEQIAGQSARLVAAQVAGEEITYEARTASPTPSEYETAAREFGQDCNRIRITFSDVENLVVIWEYEAPTGNETWQDKFDDPTTEGCIVTAAT